MFSLDNNDSEDSNAALEIAARTFKDLQDEYYEIYKMYNLSDLVIPLVIPRVSKYHIEFTARSFPIWIHSYFSNGFKK